MPKVSVIGHFGNGKTLLNGQTVKTKIITDALEDKLGKCEVMKIDTYGGIKNIFKAPFQVFSAFAHCANIVIFPAHNGLRVYVPLMTFLSHFFKNRKLHYVVIGGWLADFVKERRLLAKRLKKFDGIYVETDTMKKALELQGFSNVYVMPNCKKLTVLSEDELVYPSGVPYRLCTFSRVMKEKGIETAVNAVKSVNKELGYTAYSLDIYGQVDASQTDWFEKLQKTFPDYIRYGGLVAFDKSVETLKEYFALLFPTYYEGEGFAGTLIDAYSAGVPVIASDWKYNTELVTQQTGYIFPARDEQAISEILKAAAENPKMISDKKPLCLEEAHKYAPGRVIQILTDNLKEGK